MTGRTMNDNQTATTQAERQRIMKEAVDRIIRDTPRQVSVEMYVREVATEAFAEGWNQKAKEMGVYDGETETSTETA